MKEDFSFKSSSASVQVRWNTENAIFKFSQHWNDTAGSRVAIVSKPGGTPLYRFHFDYVVFFFFVFFSCFFFFFFVKGSHTVEAYSNCGQNMDYIHIYIYQLNAWPWLASSHCKQP